MQLIAAFPFSFSIKTPMAGAVQILRKNRLAELIPRRGARVTPLSAEYIEWLYEILPKLYSIIVSRLIEHPERD
ncbi:MAG TPA: hypothetical protein VLM75_16270 [Spirochaetota bacterium]|nr:hypothetical protein [Spirochaetota bacterium]